MRVGLLDEGEGGANVDRIAGYHRPPAFMKAPAGVRKH